MHVFFNRIFIKKNFNTNISKLPTNLQNRHIIWKHCPQHSTLHNKQFVAVLLLRRAVKNFTSSARFCPVSRVIIFIVLWSEVFFCTLAVLRYFMGYASGTTYMHRTAYYISRLDALNERTFVFWWICDLLEVRFLPSPLAAGLFCCFTNWNYNFKPFWECAQTPSRIARNLMRFIAILGGGSV